MRKLAYFPGCSLVTLAREAHEALLGIAPLLGLSLEEIEDWNCCGSSSAHSLCPALAKRLAWRVFSRVPEEENEILVMCPSCNLRLKEGLVALEKEEAREEFRRFFRREPRPRRVVHLLELLTELDWFSRINTPLKGLRLAPYYGCLLFAPPETRSERLHLGLLEEVLSRLGAEVETWRYASQCCGTYLSVVRPDLVMAIVSKMMFEARRKGIEALVTPCVMCQMNLEMRAGVPEPVPVFHLTEVLALALGEAEEGWFRRHLVDPRPLLKEKGLL